MSEDVHLQIQPTGGILDTDEISTIVLGQDHLHDLLISPEISPSLMETEHSKFSARIMGIDEKMYNLHKKLNLTALLRPQNYQSELEKFLQNPFQYNPIFSYKFPNHETQKEIEMLFDDLENEIHTLGASEFIFQKLYREKLSELKDRLLLVTGYRDENYEQIAEANRKLFGTFSPKLLDEATKKVLENPRISRENTNKILGPILTLEEIVDEIESYCKERKLPNIPVNISQTTVSRLAVAYKK